MSFISLATSRIWNRFRHHQVVEIKNIWGKIWAFGWMRLAGWSYGGRIATWVATWFAPPYKQRRFLARYSSQGYIAPSAKLACDRLRLGANIFLGDRVTLWRERTGGAIDLGERVHLHNDTVLQTSDGGKLTIGRDTHIQPGCELIAACGSIYIGSRVQIAPNCSLNSHPAQQQGHQLEIAKSDITIEDDVWLGHGVTVLAGVTIGAGAIVGSGSVVAHDISPGAIAVGIPARSVKMRSNI